MTGNMMRGSNLRRDFEGTKTEDRCEGSSCRKWLEGSNSRRDFEGKSCPETFFEGETMYVTRERSLFFLPTSITIAG